MLDNIIIEKEQVGTIVILIKYYSRDKISQITIGGNPFYSLQNW